MNKYYKIEVDMTPENGYYSWVIIDVTDDNDWLNVGFGWSKTPAIAWSDAYHKYLEITKEKNNAK
jgi:hypothetical protein